MAALHRLCWAPARGPRRPAGRALAGGAAFIGHLFPVWLKFKGGKGVATFFGILLAIAWPVGVLAGATWLAMAVAVPLLVAGGPDRRGAGAAVRLRASTPAIRSIALALFMAVLIFIRHHENIARLLKGEEPRIGAKAKTPRGA